MERQTLRVPRDTLHGQAHTIPSATKAETRIPIWVGGFWPHRGPFKRAAKWDGVLPLHTPNPIRPSPADLRSILSYIMKHRKIGTQFDVVVMGWGTQAREMKGRMKNKIQPYVEAGMTWWLESLYGKTNSLEMMRKRIRMGPAWECLAATNASREKFCQSPRINESNRPRLLFPSVLSAFCEASGILYLYGSANDAGHDVGDKNDRNG